MGYSQGALVVGDILAGGGNNSELGNTTTPPSIDFATYGQRCKWNDDRIFIFMLLILGIVNAVLLYGDPRHMPDQSFNYGNVSALDAPGVSYQLNTFS